MAKSQAARGGSAPDGGRRQTHQPRTFVFLVAVSCAISLGNIVHHHLAHDEDPVLAAAVAFRGAHFRTSRRSPGGDGSATTGGGENSAGASAGTGIEAAAVGEGGTSSEPHDVARLSCAKHGGPSDEAAAEMIYWEDIPSDSEYRSPLHPGDGDEEKFLTFEPDKGGWNNIRMAMETVLVLSHAMGRTLVLPPEQGMYLLKQKTNDQKHTFSFSDFFHLDSVAAEHAGFKVITMEEFLTREGMGGKLVDQKSGKVLKPPNDEVKWDGKDTIPLFYYLRTVGKVPIWNPTKCIAGIPRGPDPKDVEEMQKALDEIVSEKHRPKPSPEDFVDKPTSVNASMVDRMGELLGERKELCPYTTDLHEARHIHFMTDRAKHTRLLTHFYAFIFFQDWRQDLYYKRFVRDHVRYLDKIFCAAARIVEAVRERARKKSEDNPDGLYDSFHVRRGEFQYKKVKVGADVLYNQSKDELTEGSTLYIATDERNKGFFQPLADHYDVTFLDDYIHLIKGMNTNYYGMLDQLVATRGRIFFGTFFSTLTGYINRMRGYHSVKRRRPGYENGTIPSYYFVPEDRKYQMVEYRSVKLPLYMREFPTSWRDIDHGIEDTHRESSAKR